jgi:CDP-diacylglycerol---glycerol-3-phosphate 3-phosphatidyltransferase
MSVSAATKNQAGSRVFNIPNQLTASRLVLAIVLFVLIAFEQYQAGVVVFLIAAGTDWLDGYWARKYGQVTTLGRILDPFVDKIIICGTFIFLVKLPQSGIVPWMAVVVVGRELLVTALRSFLEQQGADFSASLSGKLKMVLQCGAAALSLFRLSYGESTPPAWLDWTLPAVVWGAIILTVISGVAYIFAAIRLLQHEPRS